MSTHEYTDKGERTPFLWAKRIGGIALPVLIIVGGVATVSVMQAMKPEPEKKEESVKAVPVLTQAAAREDVVLSVSAQGEVRARTQINMVPQVAGRITYMSPNFIEGGRFKKGEALIRIEPTEYKLRVTQAEADVAQAQTTLTREQSEADLALQDWEELKTGEAPSALTLRKPQLAEAAARLASAEARLGEAELQLRRTTVYAPFNGRVVKRTVNQGEYVNAGAPIGQVFDTSVMDVRLPLTNRDLSKAGMVPGFIADTKNPAIPVRISADVAGETATWSGKIVRTDAGFDPQTRVLYAYAEVRDPFSDHIPLVPGLFVSADVQGESLSGTVTVPRAALRGNDKVYVANADNTLSIKTVQVVSSDRQRAVLRGGLVPGTQVVTSPVRGVAEGMKIEPVDRLTTDVSHNEDH